MSLTTSSCLEPESLVHLPLRPLTHLLTSKHRADIGIAHSLKKSFCLSAISFSSFLFHEAPGFLAHSLPVINEGPLTADSLTRCSNFCLPCSFQFASEVPLPVGPFSFPSFLPSFLHGFFLFYSLFFLTLPVRWELNGFILRLNIPSLFFKKLSQGFSFKRLDMESLHEHFQHQKFHFM